ncbi:hypothetical protein MASR2M15_27890 [Anaerolineales bacterium]
MSLLISQYDQVQFFLKHQVDAVALIDASGVIQAVNEVFISFFNQAESDLIGTSLIDYFDLQNDEELDFIISSHLLPQTREFSYSFRTKPAYAAILTELKFKAFEVDSLAYGLFVFVRSNQENAVIREHYRIVLQLWEKAQRFMKDSFIIIERSGMIVSATEHFLHLLSLPQLPDALNFFELFDGFGNRTLSEMLDSADQGLFTEKKLSFIFHSRTFFITAHAFPLDVSGIDPQYLLVLKAHRQTQDASNRLEFDYLVTQHVSDAIVVVNVEREIVFWNSRAETIFGYPKSETYKQHIDKFLVGIHGDLFDSRKERVEFPIRVTGKWQRQIELLVSMIPVEREGELDGWVLICKDVTWQKQAEREMQQLRDQLQIVLDNAPILVYIKDLDGRYLFVNKQFQITLNRDAELVLYKTAYDIFPYETAKIFSEYDAKAIADQEAVVFEEYYPIEDDQLVFLSMRFPLRDADGLVYALCGMSTDITTLKLAQEKLQSALNRERELVELQKRFVAMVSHEYRTPLSIIHASAQSLQAYGSRMNDEDRNHRFKKIGTQITHMTSLLEDVLLIGEWNGHAPILKREVFDFVQFFKDLIEDFFSTVQTHGIVFHCQDMEILVYADRRLLRQVVNNLINNACKYSPENSDIIIDVGLSGGRLGFSIQDKGIGIPPEAIKHLFEPFYRAKNVGTLQGTGLGLAITQTAIHLHDGEIQVNSKVGEGTSFKVSLPILKEQE